MNERPISAEGAPLEAHQEGRARMLPAPRRGVVPALDDAAVRFVVLALRGEIVDGDLGVLVALEHAEAKAAVRDDLRVRLAREARRAAEVIRVGMRDDHRVDVLRREARLLQPVLDRAPGVGAGQAGIDDGRAALVDQRVHVHVAESGHPDRELHAQHAGSDLGDLALRGFLLLSARPGHGRRKVRKRVADRSAARAKNRPGHLDRVRGLAAYRHLTAGSTQAPR